VSCNARPRTLCPRRGTEWGGVSERAGTKAGGSNPFATHLLRRRDGERHPGFREGVTLRGVPAEGRPWSVRAVWRVSPHQTNAPMTADVRRAPRRGTSSACATTHTHGRVRNNASRSRTRPSLGPSTRARRSSLCTVARAPVVRRSIRHHGWANPRKWDEPSLGSIERT